jgi:nitrous oxidase accessory protein
VLAVLLLVLAADTVRVGPGGSVADAAAHAAPGTVIVVLPGTYAGDVLLSQAVTLTGSGRPVLRGGGKGTVVRITGRGVRLVGFAIEHSGTSLDRDDAGVRVEADSATLEDLVIRDVLHGVYLKQVKDVTVRRTSIRGRPELRPNDRGDGIHFYFSARVLAERNDIADVRDGMYFSYSDTTVVRGNTVARSRYGLHYMFSHRNLFEDNRFTGSAAGSSIMNSRDVIARRNVFAWNRGIESFGLLQQTTERTILEGNAFVGNGVGLFLDGAVDGVVRDNLVAGNFVGLELFSSATGNRFTGNTIAGNTYPATGGAADSRFCVGGRGNRWADDDGYDLDGDGINDVAYATGSPLSEVSRERPALRLFLASPAAGALAWAERTFPVFHIETVTDSCPLARSSAGTPAFEPPAPPSGARAEATAAAAIALAAGLAALAALRPPGAS